MTSPLSATKFLNANNNDAVRNLSLKERLSGICTRTLRKQVLEYIKFTQRVPLTQDFLPNNDEMELYRLVSLCLQRETLFALPARLAESTSPRRQ